MRNWAHCEITFRPLCCPNSVLRWKREITNFNAYLGEVIYKIIFIAYVWCYKARLMAKGFLKPRVLFLPNHKIMWLGSLLQYAKVVWITYICA